MRHTKRHLVEDFHPKYHMEPGSEKEDEFLLSREEQGWDLVSVIQVVRNGERATVYYFRKRG